MIKTKRVNGKEVVIAGVTHLPTDDDKNLGRLIQESDVIGIEGRCGYWPWGFEEYFVGEKGKKIILEKSKHVAELDVMKLCCEEKRKKYFSFDKEKENRIFPLLDEIFTTIVIFPSFLYDEIFYGGDYEKAYRRERVYRKLVDLEGNVLSILAYPVYTLKDVGMSYAIKSLTEEYDRILAVVGRNHFYPLSRFLSNPKKLERQFKKFSRCFRDEIKIRVPVKKTRPVRRGREVTHETSYHYPVVRRIALKKG